MVLHRIRLRGPWECEPLARSAAIPDERLAPLPAKCRMTLPCRWKEGGLEGFAGTVRFLRRFGAPARVDAHERLWLTFAGVEGNVSVWLNGQLLGRHDTGAGPFDFEVTNMLQPRNQMIVEVAAPTDDGGLWGEVALEVRG